jgi:hypothetical protein
MSVDIDVVFVNHTDSRAEALRQIGAALEGTFYELKQGDLERKMLRHR